MNAKNFFTLKVREEVNLPLQIWSILQSSKSPTCFVLLPPVILCKDITLLHLNA